MIATNETEQKSHIQGYYAFQARIYDLTRWTFLFGRKSMLQVLPFQKNDTFRLLEVGCGTGVNLAYLAKKYPHATLEGIDLSTDMLAKAEKTLNGKAKLHSGAYPLEKNRVGEEYDIILFSYCLTMVNPHYEALIKEAYHDLKKGGYIAVADFDTAHLAFYRQFMYQNHVKLDGQLLPILERDFEPILSKNRKAYGGVWSYFNFLGKK